MPLELIANFPLTTVSSGGTGAPSSGSTETWTVASSSSFPAASNSATPPTLFRVADPALPGEVIAVTNVSGTTWTVTRGAEGTATSAHTAGFTVKQVLSAGSQGNVRQVANVRSAVYGAKGDGSTNDTSAIQAALNTGMDVYLPAGTYNASGLYLTADGQQVFGDGPAQTAIRPASPASLTADVLMSSQMPASAGLSGFIRNYAVIRDLAVDGSNMTGTVAGAGNGVHFYGARYSRIFNCYIHNVPNYAVLLDGDNTGPGVNFGYNVHVRDCIFDACAGGVKAVNCEACNIIECEFKYAGTATAANQPLFTSPSTYAGHMHMTNGYAYIAGNVFGNLGTYTTEAVRLENSGPCRVIGNRFDQVRYQAVHCTAGANVIAGNQIGNPSSSGTVEGILLGSGGNLVEGNTFDLTNGAAHFTYCISEGGAYTGNVIEGNSFSAGTSGVLNLNGSSTPVVGLNNGGGAQIPVADTTATDILPNGTQAAGSNGKWADSGHVHPLPSGFFPADGGFLEWNYDPVIASTQTALPTAGQITLIRVPVRVARSVTNVVYYLGTLGASLTSGQCFAGLYNSSGTLIGTSADQTANWNTGGTTGLYTTALTGGPFNVSAGFCWVALLFNGTTGPAIGRCNNLATAIANAGFGAAASRYAHTATGGQTSLTGFTPSGNVQTAIEFWAALS